MDWLEWHDLYDSSPELIARLGIVRTHIARCLDALPAGALRVLSICAGDGRDVIPTVAAHGRRRDVRARLIEQEPTLIDRAREEVSELGLDGAFELIAGDATAVTAYDDFIPADLVLACGVFGNVKQSGAPRLVESLTALCAHDGLLIWTRRVSRRLRPGQARLVRGDGADPTAVRDLLRQHSFEEVQIDYTPDGKFVIATCRHRGEVSRLRSDGRPLFTFSDTALFRRAPD